MSNPHSDLPPQLVTMGETLALLSSWPERPLRHATSLDLTIGGSESNVAIGAARLGVRTAWMGRVGDDEFGQLITRELLAERVLLDTSVDPHRPTGLMLKSRRTGGLAQVTYYRQGSAGANLAIADLDTEILRTATVFHTSAITPALGESARDAVHQSLELCQAFDTRISIDLNYRRVLWDRDTAATEYRYLISKADIVFATEDEARIVSDADTPAGLAQDLTKLGATNAVIKLGSHGAVACVDGAEVVVQPVPVRVVDSVGAGDAFAAGYLTGLIDGAATKECLAWGNLMGAWSVSTRGDWQGLPNRDELHSINTIEDDVRR